MDFNTPQYSQAPQMHVSFLPPTFALAALTVWNGPSPAPVSPLLHIL